MCGQVVPGGSLSFVLYFFVRHTCHTHGLEIEKFGSIVIVNEQAIDWLAREHSRAFRVWLHSRRCLDGFATECHCDGSQTWLGQGLSGLRQA